MTNADERESAGERESADERENTEKDRSYSPSSGRETEVMQQESASSAVDTAAAGDVDDDAIVSRPGVGGPDDAGDVEVDDEAIREGIAARDADPGDRPTGESR